MYKICFYEDITGEVTSSPVPFGEEALKAMINVSDSINWFKKCAKHYGTNQAICFGSLQLLSVVFMKS